MTTLIVALLICIVFSAYFSGSEMAFISSNKFKFRDKAEEGDSNAKKVARLHGDTEGFLTTILIGNNIVNILATALLTYALQVYFGVQSEWVTAVIMTPILLIFGEMVPKEYCRLRSDSVLVSFAGSLTFFVRLLKYPTKLVLKAIDLILSPLGVVENKSIFVSESEFRSLIEESAKAGVVETHEKQMIDTILDFEHITTDSVMKPLDKVAKTDIHSNVGDIKKIASRTKARMVLVYEEDPQIVVGMIYVFDILFEEDETKSLRTFLRSPIFLSGSSSIETSFLTLQQQRQSYAVVTNQIGETVGVVPIEKLLVYK